MSAEAMNQLKKEEKIKKEEEKKRKKMEKQQERAKEREKNKGPHAFQKRSEAQANEEEDKNAISEKQVENKPAKGFRLNVAYLPIETSEGKLISNNYS